MLDPKIALWLEFEHWMVEDVPIDYDNNYCNLTVTLPPGRVYALNVWTYAYCRQVMRELDDCPARVEGSYMLPPDLLVKRLDRELIEAVVADLVSREELRKQWLVVDQNDV